MTPTPYKRVLLKLSGESFARAGERGISMEEVVHIAEQTVRVASRGVQVAVVIGGGNTAVDVATAAIRFGAKQVTIAYRRGEDAIS